MPKLSQVAIRGGIAYLVLGLALLALVQANRALQLSDLIWALQPAAYHLIVVGWLTQLIVGVAYWMFPTAGGRVRGGERALAASLALLNAGLLLRLVFEPLSVWRPGATAGAALALSGALQALATWGFAIALWPRVRARGGRAAAPQR